MYAYYFNFILEIPPSMAQAQMFTNKGMFKVLFPLNVVLFADFLVSGVAVAS